MKTVLSFLISVLFFNSCQRPSGSNSSDESSNSLPIEFKRIDVHSHFRYDRDCLIPLLDKWNMNTALVDVVAMDPTRNYTLWEALKNQYNKYPGRFYLCASFAALNIDDPDFAQRTIEKLKKDIEAGARMVKVWKVHGMEIKDKSGNYIQIDDERIQPVWDFLTEQNIPVMAHIAEPEQAWRALEEGNSHYNYYKNHPQYHAYLHPEIPSWETIIAARDNWIAKNPKLTILAAHMGSMSHDLDLVAERLDKYPNMLVEPAARFGDITDQDSKKVFDFFIKYQDRILYGTDLGFSEPQQPGDNTNPCDYLDEILSIHWKYFSGSNSLNFNSPMISFPVKTNSLNLPDAVLRKFYYENALKLLTMAGK